MSDKMKTSSGEQSSSHREKKRSKRRLEDIPGTSESTREREAKKLRKLEKKGKKRKHEDEPTTKKQTEDRSRPEDIPAEKNKDHGQRSSRSRPRSSRSNEEPAPMEEGPGASLPVLPGTSNENPAISAKIEQIEKELSKIMGLPTESDDMDTNN